MKDRAPVARIEDYHRLLAGNYCETCKCDNVGVKYGVLWHISGYEYPDWIRNWVCFSCGETTAIMGDWPDRIENGKPIWEEI